MNLIDRVIAAVSPTAGLRRMRARAVLSIISARYDIASPSPRNSSFRPVRSDADAASHQRLKMAWIARDMVRNTAFGQRVQSVVANNVVGAGIIAKIKGPSKRQQAQFAAVWKQHFETTACDADGRNNLYGLQRLAMMTVVDAGEALIRMRRRKLSDGLPLPFQMQVLEPDFLAVDQDRVLPDGNEIREGIEFDQIGRRVAYHLYVEHPGRAGYVRGGLKTVRVPADDIIHIYRQDRPGQQRGVTWYAPIAQRLQDLSDHQEAQLLRQKIAACFVAFRTSAEVDEAVASAEGATDYDVADELIPGRIETLPPGDSITLATPPAAQGYDEFTRNVLRSIAADLGVTYEALTGDMSNVNFSSGRMGRMEMDRNVECWQWLMLVPQMLDRVAAWAIRVDALATGRDRGQITIEWVPPYRVLVNPGAEIAAMSEKIKAGLASRSATIRELGYDPDDVLAEIADDRAKATEAQLIFSTDVQPKTPAAPPVGAGGQ